jgi:hypothetical protein
MYTIYIRKEKMIISTDDLLLGIEGKLDVEIEGVEFEEESGEEIEEE